MIGAYLTRLSRFLPSSSCPLPPTPFPPGPDTPIATHASDVTRPHQGGVAIFSRRNLHNLWCCYTAPGFGSYTGVPCVCADEGEIIGWVCVRAFARPNVYVGAQNNVHLTQSGSKMLHFPNTPCPASCVCCSGRCWEDRWRTAQTEALWSTLRSSEDGREGEVVVMVQH